VPTPQRIGHTRRWSIGVLVAYLAALAVAAFLPQPTDFSAQPTDEWSIPEGLLADTIRNLVLLGPIGAAVVLWGRTTRAAIATGFVLSLTIEMMQLAIPGRFASPLDLLTNTLGAAVGALLAATRHSWLAPSSRAASRLSLAACASAGCVLLGAALLLRPAFPASTYFGGWTLELARLAHYDGRVLNATAGATPIPAFGPVRDSNALRRELEAEAPIVVHALAGPPPSSTAPLVTIHDQLRREILLIGIDGHDLVFRRRSHASALGLENPSMRFPDALSGVGLNTPLSIRIVPREPSPSAMVGGRAPYTIGWTAGRSWALLASLPSSLRGLESAIDAGWLAALFFPAAYWARRRPSCWVGVAALLLLITAMPQLGPMRSTPPHEWLVAVASISTAHWCSRLSYRSGRPT
jgi:VanZ family protein